MKYIEYPVLFEKSTDDFTTQGIGILTDCLSIEVTNEFNELPELSLSYLATGDIADELKKGRIIVCDVGENYLKQRFRIDDVKKSIDNKIEVAATHILDDLSYNTLKNDIKSSAVTPVTAFNLLKNSLEQPEPSLILTSNITTTTDIDWPMNVITDAKKALGGANGSLLQIYKGEYIFDNNTIIYQSTIGHKTGKVIEYGKDLIQVNQEENISETYSAIKPFTKTGSGDDEKLVYLPERIIKSHADSYEKLRIQTKDFSQDKIETVDQLRTRTNQYIKDSKVGIPKVSLEFEMADIKDDLGFVDELDMGDEVTVYFANLGIDTTARVIKTVWDGLLHRYKTVSIGDKPTTTSDYQSEQNTHINNVDQNVSNVSKDVGAVSKDVSKVKDDVTEIQSDIHDYDEYMKNLTSKVNSTRDEIFNFIDQPGDGIIKFTPNRDSPTDMTIESSAGSKFRLNSRGIMYDGTGKTAMDSRGNVYADTFVGQKITGVYVESGEFHGGRITGDAQISLSGTNGNVVSLTSYGISSSYITVTEIDGLRRMTLGSGAFININGAKLEGDGNGHLLVNGSRVATV